MSAHALCAEAQERVACAVAQATTLARAVVQAQPVVIAPARPHQPKQVKGPPIFTWTGKRNAELLQYLHDDPHYTELVTKGINPEIKMLNISWHYLKGKHHWPDLDEASDIMKLHRESKKHESGEWPGGWVLQQQVGCPCAIADRAAPQIVCDIARFAVFVAAQIFADSCGDEP